MIEKEMMQAYIEISDGEECGYYTLDEVIVALKRAGITFVLSDPDEELYRRIAKLEQALDRLPKDYAIEKRRL